MSQIGDQDDLDESDLWSGILVAVSFETQSMCHTTMQAMPAQLVFSRDALLNIEFQVDWNLIKSTSNSKQMKTTTEKMQNS